MTEYEFIQLACKEHLKLCDELWCDPDGYSMTWFFLEWCDIDSLENPSWQTAVGISSTYDSAYTRRIDLMKQYPSRYYRVVQSNIPKGCTIPYKGPTLNVLKIEKQTMADGPGLRNTLFVAGCDHKCPGCHNESSWDYTGGIPMSIFEIADELLDPYADITISGGDPLSIPNRHNILLLLQVIHTRNPYKNIWLYTGYTIEQIKDQYPEVLKYIDVLVDGPYKQALRNTDQYCGSINQRIIYLKDGSPEECTKYIDGVWRKIPWLS